MARAKKTNGCQITWSSRYKISKHKNIFNGGELNSSKDGLEVWGQEHTHCAVTTSTCSLVDMSSCNLKTDQ
jgi:hypothetical protein